jgi:hypothetical protein
MHNHQNHVVIAGVNRSSPSRQNRACWWPQVLKRDTFSRLNGTSELVPFPFVEMLEFFNKL